MTNGTYPIDRKGSVTEGDTKAFVVYGGMGLFDTFPIQQTIAAKPGLPAWWSPVRDALLSQSLHLEDMWAAAVAKAVTKQAARGFTIEDSEDSQVRVERSQRTLLWYDGSVWSLGIQKWLQDFLLTDNGAFMEVERDGRQPWARATALWHLDSQCCFRTGNPRYPVVYWSGDGQWHKLRYDQVIAVADMPSPRRMARGIGLCAASRAWNTITKLSAVETYFREKITGSRTLAIHIVNGLSRQQLSDALASSDDEQERKNFYVYKGVLVVPTVKADAPPSLVTIPLAEVPDGFDVAEERKDAYLRYANALGIPVQDVQPLSGQGLGTGTQTIILAEEAEGYGLAAGMRALTQSINTFVLPKATTFSLSNANDARERLQKASADKAQAEVLGLLVTMGALTALQAQNIAADEGLIPKEFVPNDATAGGTLSDDEKPIEVETTSVLQQARERLQMTATPMPTVTKAAQHTGVMIALYPDAKAAHAIVSQAGVTETVDALHLTLAFMGDSSEFPNSNDKQRLIDALSQWAKEKGKPLSGTINGLGRFFNAESDDTNAVYVSPDVPGLPELRQSLCDWIDASGFDYAQNHGFTPHMTVAYVPVDAPTPSIRVETPVTFDTVTLAWGDEHIDFPLGITKTKAASIDSEWDAALKWVDESQAEEQDDR